MGLVDYSDSESDSETVRQQPAPAALVAPKKHFQKLLDRSSGSGKIVVNLPAASSATDTSDDDGQPPAKRAKTTGGSRFSGLGSFLPPPKKTGAAAPAASERKLGAAPAPGVHLRTATEPAFVRRSGDAELDFTDDVGGNSRSPGLGLPPSSSKGPSIPEGQKPEEEVKLVGKPLMFKPLSVARKKTPAKNKKKEAVPVTASVDPDAAAPQNGSAATVTAPAPSAEPPKKKKISLFSVGDDESTPTTSGASPATDTYEPIYTTDPAPPQEEEDESDVTSAYPTYQHHPPPTPNQQQQQPQSLSSLADGLSSAARRELFGRSRRGADASSSTLIPPNAKVISFDMEQEYAHNESLRASGAQQAYNPVRSIAPGKHSLRQVVNMAQSNQSALEESFARAKSNQRDAAGRYGWK
ncbi:mitotic checkpoint regulator, MAD2B-interacting-domain-containing protein [Achaetomium macrosporum]|uniref:Mitotic checkpoint regulator, MAD2B-interacting-domain-containing protein n=1 Tax=Achaetomium macrosporum TaxID=79813 RepID=A0AAN7C892_9PEZI|nr:mitotic checkpoint regulator, MAD2B-interacting-domain-containing protein [Achaetomium macrosporum]